MPKQLEFCAIGRAADAGGWFLLYRYAGDDEGEVRTISQRYFSDIVEALARLHGAPESVELIVTGWPRENSKA